MVYHQRTINGKHQNINMGCCVTDIPNGLVPDHKDRNFHNNVSSNVRCATEQQNRANSGPQGDGYKYVTKMNRVTPKPFVMKIMKDGIRYVSVHSTAGEAAKAGDLKAIELWGEFAYTNFPRENYTTQQPVRDVAPVDHQI